MEVVALLEGYGTALAATRMRPSDFSAARAATADMSRALAGLDPAAASEANRRFHEILVDRCGNPYLIAQVRDAWDRLDIIQRGGFRPVRYLPRRGLQSLAEHEKLLQLLKDRSMEPALIERTARKHRERTVRFYERELPEMFGDQT